MSILQRIMDRFGSVPEKSPQLDHSPALQPGAVKAMLVAAAGEYLPGFSFQDFRNDTYFFQRIRNAGGHRVYEMLQLAFTLDNGHFACSVASRLNPSLRYTTAYNKGIVNPHQNLKVLRHGADNLSQKEARYWHSGRIAGTAAIVRDIFADYRRYGVPFLDQQWNNVQQHPLLQAGFDYLSGQVLDRTALKTELEAELNNRGGQLEQLQHPVYLELRDRLKQLSGMPRADRQLIPLMAGELLFWYGEEGG